VDVSFTITTPNYNTGRFLSETIESVLRNLRPGDEYYVVDGGSTDGSLDVIKRYESRLSGWSSGPDRGYSDAVAKGFQLGSGQVLAWVNSSDLLLPGALDCARMQFLDPEIDWIFGDDYHIDEAGIVQFRSHGGAWDLRNLMLYGSWTPLQDACFFRRSIYEKVGGLNPATRYAADFEFFLKLSIAGRPAYTPCVFSAFRKHAGQTSIDGVQKYREERSAIQRHFRTIEGDSVIKRSAFYVWARLRARFCQGLWNSRAFQGRSISELTSECSGTR
jgi:glycosyltransferase involved in cell wall biosynthesis